MKNTMSNVSSPGCSSRSLALAALATICCGCSVLVDRSSVQCTKDSDCARGGAFEGTICTQEGVCGREACDTHADCAGRFDDDSPGYCRPSDRTCANLFAHPACSALLP